jgi:heptosyltransferase I
VSFAPEREAGKIDISTARKIERILIVRLSAMGDVIHTLPAVHALRCAFPQAHFGWLIEERWAELLCAPGFPRRGVQSAQRPLVDEVHTVKLKVWGKSLFSVSTVEQMAKVWNDIRDAHYDVAVDLQGAIRSAVLARLSGAKSIFGSAQPRESPASLLYTRKVVQQGRHVIEQSFSVAESLTGHAAAMPEVQFPRDPASEARVAQRLAELDVENFVLLNPGAGWGAKRWPAGRYGEVARRLADRGMRSVVNYGPGEEEMVRTVEEKSAGAARGIRCTISELIGLTRRARLFIGGDTGPLHLAAALQVPVVAIFGPTDPARNGPYGTRSIVLRSAASVNSYTHWATTDDGLLEINSSAVAMAAEKLLSGGNA